MVSTIEQGPSKNADNHQNQGVEHVSRNKQNGKQISRSNMGNK